MSRVDYATKRRQIEREKAARSEARNRFCDWVVAAKARQGVSRIHSGQTALSKFFHSDQLNAYLAAIDLARGHPTERKKVAKRQREGVLAKRLSNLDTNTIAFFSISSVIDNMTTKPSSFQAVSRRLGEELEEEVKQTILAAANPKALYKAKKAAFRYSGNLASFNPDDLLSRLRIRHEPWTDEECAELGQHLLRITMERTDLVDTLKADESADDSRWDLIHPVPADDVSTLIAKSEKKVTKLQRGLKPLICPPKPWRSMREGGYYSIQVPFVRQGRHNRWIDAHSENFPSAKQLPDVYSAVNSQQNTSWRVNNDILAVIEEILDLGIKNYWKYGIPGFDPPNNQDIRDNEHSNVQRDRRRGGLTFQMRMHRKRAVVTIEMARELRKKVFYYAYRPDYRGRIYPEGGSLQPQGDDLALGLLRFAEPTPIGRAGERWLAVHGANAFGVKGTFDERVEWVAHHSERIIANSENALKFPREDRAKGSDVRWPNAKNPYQFLAFCFDWARLHERGQTFRSAIPCAVDGTANGLQHLSCLANDPKLAGLTNVRPTSTPSDLYQAVADSMKEISVADVEETALLARIIHERRNFELAGMA